MEVLFKRISEKTQTLYYQQFNNIPELIEEKQVKDPFDIVVKEYSKDYSGIINATERHPYFKFLSQSSDPKELKENYGNPMCASYVNRMTFVVEKDETKVSMKLYLYSKNRRVGDVYFRKASKMMFVTYCLKTNHLYSGSITNAFKKKKFSKRLRKNYFASHPIQCIITNFKNNFRSYLPENIDFENQDEIVNEAVSKFVSNIPKFPEKYTINDNGEIDVLMYKQYLSMRDIKYPNNYPTFISLFPLPNKRILKKCKNKLVDSIMMVHKLKGDKIKKVLHISNYINIEFYKKVESFFGEDFIRHVKDNEIHTVINFKGGYSLPNLEYELSKAEVKNIFDIFITTLNGVNNYHNFIDHVRFYNLIKKYENIKWKSFNISTFNKEHSEWTDKYDHYTKGTYTRFYGEQFTKVTTQVIKIDGEDYYPVLLTSSNEYNMESTAQSNCVKTYIDRASAIIFSVRKGSIDSQERATIEYQIGLGFKDQLVFRRRQSLGRFNYSLDKKWDMVLNKLDENLNLSKDYFEKPKVRVEFGGGVIESESHFGEDNKSNFDWVSPYLRHIRPINQNNLINMDLEF